MPTGALVPAIVFGCALTPGFLRVRGAGRDWIVTHSGSFRRDGDAGLYGFRTIHCRAGPALVFVAAIATMFGLPFSK
ncbi:MAG TPA: hypothetical protein VMH86_17445 [Rhizomicrobium sp.]|nr:hypothetical protein [Rhizomicrobium sp.]